MKDPARVHDKNKATDKEICFCAKQNKVIKSLQNRVCHESHSAYSQRNQWMLHLTYIMAKYDSL